MRTWIVVFISPGIVKRIGRIHSDFQISSTIYHGCRVSYCLKLHQENTLHFCHVINVLKMPENMAL